MSEICFDLSLLFLSFLLKAQKAESHYDSVGMRTNRRVALFFNIGAVITYFVTLMVAIVIAVRVSALVASTNCYSNYNC